MNAFSSSTSSTFLSPFQAYFLHSSIRIKCINCRNAVSIFLSGVKLLAFRRKVETSTFLKHMSRCLGYGLILYFEGGSYM